MTKASLKEALDRIFEGSKSAVKRSFELYGNIDCPLLDELILNGGKLPDVGLADDKVEEILQALASLDANNQKKLIGVGEREGRVVSKVVSKRYYGFSHGIGRSGNLTEIQPKALGSSLLQLLTNKLAREAVKACGMREGEIRETLVLPCATGMALTLVFRALAKKNPKAKWVVMSRMDQKSAIKAVLLAGLKPVIFENLIEGDGIKANMNDIQSYFHKNEYVLCVLSTTSCFAPRLPDEAAIMANACDEYDIPHVVNNAYGLQSEEALKQLHCFGRIDVVVQSTDKNFMTPVGGSIVFGRRNLIEDIGQVYPGRASMAPIMDLFITLLSLGQAGITDMLAKRKECFTYFKERLNAELPEGYRVLETPENDVSIAIKIKEEGDGEDNEVSSLGSKLFYRNVSGARLVPKTGKPFDLDEKLVCGIDGKWIKKLNNFGTHCPNYPHSYLTVASSVGQTKEEIDAFMDTLLKLITFK